MSAQSEWFSVQSSGCDITSNEIALCDDCEKYFWFSALADPSDVGLTLALPLGRDEYQIPERCGESFLLTPPARDGPCGRFASYEATARVARRAGAMPDTVLRRDPYSSDDDDDAPTESYEQEWLGCIESFYLDIERGVALKM